MTQDKQWRFIKATGPLDHQVSSPDATQNCDRKNMTFMAPNDMFTNNYNFSSNVIPRMLFCLYAA